ncbi:hypothetical protein [Mesorhizobium sp. CN2-181]|uniref:hypothetical protein n=1 Tax=Mesorhizobium yinganensis TaxID=3157707 RepID=UPI0032B73BC3
MIDKTPEEVLKLLSHRGGFNSDILRIIANRGPARPLGQEMPWVLKKQLGRMGIRTDDPGAIFESLKRLNWPKQQYEALKRRYPNLKCLVRSENQLAIGTTSEARFNGDYYKLRTGYVLTFPLGAHTFLRSLAEMFGAMTDLVFRETMARGFSESTGLPNWWLIRKIRSVRVKAAINKRVKDEVSDLAYDAERTFRSYTDIGAAEISWFREKCGPMPLSAGMFGHPLEVGSHLSLFATNFLVLHELGHVNHDHDPRLVNDPAQSISSEFQADRFAINTILNAPIGEIEKMAGLVGAFFFLYVAVRLEELGEAEDAITHPSASARLDQLLEALATHDTSREVKYVFTSMTLQLARIGDLFRKESMLPAEKLSNTVRRILYGSIEFNMTQAFVEQVLRWMLIGSPDKLCQYLGNLKFQLEAKLREEPDQRDVVAFGLIAEVYEVTKDNFIIRDKLDIAYRNAVSGRETAEQASG